MLESYSKNSIKDYKKMHSTNPEVIYTLYNIIFNLKANLSMPTSIPILTKIISS
jgi:hypothetical protein